jgi:hypothetical protein
MSKLYVVENIIGTIEGGKKKPPPQDGGGGMPDFWGKKRRIWSRE